MKPLILITNDDGILSPGLHAAAEAVMDFADLLIVAPHTQQTSMGRSFPKTDDIGIIDGHELILNGVISKAYGVHGSPATAVSHAILELADRKPDLCISGINYGENIGLSLSCSGTVGAAFEANSYDIPSIAISLEVPIENQHSNEFGKINWSAAKYFTRIIAKYILKNNLDPQIALLNINVPSNANENTEVLITRQSRQNYFIFNKPEKREFTHKHRLSVSLEINKETLEINSDIYAFVYKRAVSITPVTWDMTANIPIEIKL